MALTFSIWKGGYDIITRKAALAGGPGPFATWRNSEFYTQKPEREVKINVTDHQFL